MNFKSIYRKKIDCEQMKEPVFFFTPLKVNDLIWYKRWRDLQASSSHLLLLKMNLEYWMTCLRLINFVGLKWFWQRFLLTKLILIHWTHWPQVACYLIEFLFYLNIILFNEYFLSVFLNKLSRLNFKF